LGEDYGFTAAQVGKMTLYQIRTYLAEEKDLGPGVRVVGGSEWAELKRKWLKKRRRKGNRKKP